jgi:transcriptional regulator NrdR family protein
VWFPRGVSIRAGDNDVLIPSVGPYYYPDTLCKYSPNESEEKSSRTAVEDVKKSKEKFRRRCKHCDRRFTEYVPWVHHNCRVAAALACRVCFKEFEEEKPLFGHCSASVGKIDVL